LGGDAIEKLGPQRDRRPFVGGDCSNFGVVVFTVVRAVLPRSQVEGQAPSFLPVGLIDAPVIGVPLIERHRMAAVGAH
jgi:hypothetical protein